VLLSIVATELGLGPVRDREWGYAVAKHYLSGMKDDLVADAQRLGLDADGLARFVSVSHRVTPRIELARRVPGALARRVRAALAQ
jgi:hypothetical protein